MMAETNKSKICMATNSHSWKQNVVSNLTSHDHSIWKTTSHGHVKKRRREDWSICWTTFWSKWGDIYRKPSQQDLRILKCGNPKLSEVFTPHDKSQAKEHPYNYRKKINLFMPKEVLTKLFYDWILYTTSTQIQY